jgi:uncharacterized membrane protein HdeD (DUF308 family)
MNWKTIKIVLLFVGYAVLIAAPPNTPSLIIRIIALLMCHGCVEEIVNWAESLKN